MLTTTSLLASLAVVLVLGVGALPTPDASRRGGLADLMSILTDEAAPRPSSSVLSRTTSSQRSPPAPSTTTTAPPPGPQSEAPDSPSAAPVHDDSDRSPSAAAAAGAHVPDASAPASPTAVTESNQDRAVTDDDHEIDLLEPDPYPIPSLEQFDDLIPINDPDTVTNPDSDSVSNHDPDTVSNPDPDTVSNPDPDTVSNPDPDIVSNSDPDTVSRRDPDTVSNSDRDTDNDRLNSAPDDDQRHPSRIDESPVEAAPVGDVLTADAPERTDPVADPMPIMTTVEDEVRDQSEPDADTPPHESMTAAAAPDDDDVSATNPIVAVSVADPAATDSRPDPEMGTSGVEEGDRHETRHDTDPIVQRSFLIDGQHQQTMTSSSSGLSTRSLCLIVFIGLFVVVIVVSIGVGRSPRRCGRRARPSSGSDAALLLPSPV